MVGMLAWHFAVQQYAALTDSGTGNAAWVIWTCADRRLSPVGRPYLLGTRGGHAVERMDQPIRGRMSKLKLRFRRAFGTRVVTAILIFTLWASISWASSLSDAPATSAPATSPTAQAHSMGPDSVPAALPFAPIYGSKNVESPSENQNSVDWNGLANDAWRFLAIMQAYRVATEPGTRAGLKGAFFDNYASSIENLHGWADGDEFLVNYVGHPMQGAVSGYIWVHNDRQYRLAEFGRNRFYWKSRLRAAAYAWAYSEQFEIGLVSEASIGAIQKYFPQQGFVDHVITPTIGMAWMIAEDS